MTMHSSLDFQASVDDRSADLRAGLIKPEDLGLLGRVLETHCTTYGIRSEEGRGSVAHSLMGHFRSGVVDEINLLAILEREDCPLPKQVGRTRVAV